MIKFFAKFFTVLALSIVSLEYIGIIVMIFLDNPMYGLFMVFTEIIVIVAIAFNDKAHKKEEYEWIKYKE